MGMSERVYIAIDPGLKGAIVALKGREIIYQEAMPMTAWGFDTRKLCAIIQKIKLENEDVTIVTERLHAIFGVRADSTFKLGMAYQNVLSAGQLTKVRLVEVKPTEWTKVIWTNLNPIYKAVPKKKEAERADKNAKLEAAGKKPKKANPKFDSKKMSLQAIEKIFPNEKFYYNAGGTLQDGKVDATLIAEYARRMNL
jgi:hypothetical protein